MDLKISPLVLLPKDQVEYYWQSLYMDGRLDCRLCDLDHPTWSDVKDMIVRMGQQIFHIVHDDTIKAEFMLENFTGEAAQIHFSMSPDVKMAEGLAICKQIGDEILSWSKLKTLYGLTPVSNRPACIFVLKSGFTKIGILPHGIKDRGKVVDAMISIKTR